MSVYNGEKYLREAIDSILGQTSRDFEFIIVDDGSADGTWAILQSYDDPRIVLLRNDENIGLTRSLNKGLAVARGEYIARMDADDISLSKRLEKQVAYLDAHPEVGLIGTWVEIIGERGERLSVVRMPIDPLLVKWLLLFENCLVHSSVMYRRSLVEKLGGYPPSFYTQDYDLWSRMSFETQIVILPEILVKWRRHPARITAQKFAQQEAFASEISARNIRRLLSNENVSTQTIENMRTLWSGRNESIRGQSLEQTAADFKRLLLLFCEQYLSSGAMSDMYGESLDRRLGRLKEHVLSRMYFHLAIRYYRSGDMSNARRCLLQAFIRRPASVTAAVTGRIVLRTLIGERAFGLLKRTRQAFLHLRCFKYVNFIVKDRSRISHLLHNVTTDEQRINVLFIIPYMTIGGAERVTLNLAYHLNKNLFQLHFITTLKDNNVWHDRFAEQTQNIFHLPEILSDNPYSHMCFITEYIERASIDVILITHSRRGYDCLPSIRRKYPDIMVVDLLHLEGPARDQGGYPKYSARFDRFIDKRVVVSNYLRDLIVREHGIDPQKVVVIKNGVEMGVFDSHRSGKYRNRYCNNHSDKLISYIGRLDYEKHPEYIIEIANRLVNGNEMRNYKFILAGEGSLLESLRELVSQCNLRRNVFLLGSISDVSELLADSDLLLLTSEAEGIPFAVLEAMSMGVPVISTRVGAVPEIIDDGINGFLIDYDADMIESFCSRIRTLLTNQKMYMAFSTKAIEKIRMDFSIESMIHKYETLLMSCKKGKTLNRVPMASYGCVSEGITE